MTVFEARSILLEDDPHGYRSVIEALSLCPSAVDVFVADQCLEVRSSAGLHLRTECSSFCSALLKHFDSR